MRRRGFTLVELMVHLFVASLIFMMVFAIILSINKLYSKMRYRYSVEMRLLDTIDAMRVWSATSESMDWFYIDNKGDRTSVPQDKAVMVFYPSFPGEWISYQVEGICKDLGFPGPSCNRLKALYTKEVLRHFGKANMILFVRKVSLTRQKRGFRVEGGVFIPDRLKNILRQIRLPKGVERISAWDIVLIYIPDEDYCKTLSDCGVKICNYEDIDEASIDRLRRLYYQRSSCGISKVSDFVRIKEAIALDNKSLKKILDRNKNANLLGLSVKASLKFFPEYVYYISSSYSSTTAIDKFNLDSNKNKFHLNFQVTRSKEGILTNEMFSLNIPVSIVVSSKKKGSFKEIKNEDGEEIGAKDIVEVRGKCSADKKCKGKELEGIIVEDD